MRSVLVHLIFNLLLSVLTLAGQNASEEAVRSWFAQGAPFKEENVLAIANGVDTGHPEGLEIQGNNYYLSLMDETKNSSKSECRQSRIIQLEKKDGKLFLVKEKIISSNEKNECHLGGLNWGFNKDELWSPLAQFKASSSTTMLGFNPRDFSINRSIKFADHIGSQIVSQEAIYAFSWDSRKLYKAELCNNKAGECIVTQIPEQRARSVSYQDCKTLISDARPLTAICSGLDFEPWNWNIIGFLRWDLWWQQEKSWEWPLKFERTGYLDWIELNSKGTHLLGRMLSPKVDGVFLTRNPMSIWEQRQGNLFKLHFAFMPQDYPETKLHLYNSGWLDLRGIKVPQANELRNLSGTADNLNNQ